MLSDRQEGEAVMTTSRDQPYKQLGIFRIMCWYSVVQRTIHIEALDESD